MSLNTSDEQIIQINKYRFYDFYYEIKDEYLIHGNENCSNSMDTYHKPDNHACMLVKRVYDNYLLSSEICDYYKLIEALRFCNELIANDNDIFELLNPSTVNILFTQINNYGIVLVELENGGLMIKNILDHINTLKLKSTLLENLLYIVHKNLNTVNMTSRTNSYESRSLSVSSDLSKAPMEALTNSLADSIAGKSTPNNIYNYIVHWVFIKYKKRMFWITTELHSCCIKLMRFNNILTEECCSLISQTLKRFIRPDLLISKLTHQWNIEFELIESLNMLKNKIITKDQHWIKPAIRQYSQIVHISPETGKKMTFILIDGANWFYNARGGNIGYPAIDKSKLSPEEIAKIGTPQWEDSIVKRIHIHTHHKLTYDITDTFVKNLRIIVVFNERHAGFIGQINPDLHKYIVYTPRGVSDDAMILYLWLTNPGSFLLSNDLYNDWANALSGNHYLTGLWNQWVSCMKISK